MSAELRIGLRHWLAAVAGAALLHALMIAALETRGALGWLGTDEARRPAAVGRGLHVSVSLVSPLSSVSSVSPVSPPSSSSSSSFEPPETLESFERLGPAASGDSSSRMSLPEATSDPLERAAVASIGEPARALSETLSDAAFDDLSKRLATELSGDVPNDLDAGEPPGANAVTRSGAGIEAGDSNALDYFGALYERVQGALDYPRRARREQIEGTVLVSIRIDRQGRVASCRVRESSGSALLDRHAVRTIHRAAPFGAVPASTDDRELDFDLPLEYRLR